MAIEHMTDAAGDTKQLNMLKSFLSLESPTIQFKHQTELLKSIFMNGKTLEPPSENISPGPMASILCQH